MPYIRLSHSYDSVCRGLMSLLWFIFFKVFIVNWFFNISSLNIENIRNWISLFFFNFFCIGLSCPHNLNHELASQIRFIRVVFFSNFFDFSLGIEFYIYLFTFYGVIPLSWPHGSDMLIQLTFVSFLPFFYYFFPVNIWLVGSWVSLLFAFSFYCVVPFSGPNLHVQCLNWGWLKSVFYFFSRFWP